MGTFPGTSAIALVSLEIGRVAQLPMEDEAFMLFQKTAPFLKPLTIDKNDTDQGNEGCVRFVGLRGAVFCILGIDRNGRQDSEAVSARMRLMHLLYWRAGVA
jgi:hypothetical protein